MLEAIRLINKKIMFIYASSDKAYGELGNKSYDEVIIKKAYIHMMCQISIRSCCTII